MTIIDNGTLSTVSCSSFSQVGPILTFQNDMDKEYDRADGPIIEEIIVTSPSNLPPATVDSNDSEGGIGSKKARIR